MQPSRDRAPLDKLCFSKSTPFETDHIFDAAFFILDFKSSEARLNMVLVFGAAVVAAAVWSIWGTEMFPPPPDPKGDPATWTREEMRRWLAARNLFPQGRDSREDLLERIQANMRMARK
ncbi:hypothetical protein E4U32_007183 [Claviceps aff. humidiphila group G2b]|nr:hypothetical protein E4U32_007183 [Claviceps aff. humidiphila group G2b]